jgi:hypothetical protein
VHLELVSDGEALCSPSACLASAAFASCVRHPLGLSHSLVVLKNASGYPSGIL